MSDIKWGLYDSSLKVYGDTRRDRIIYETQTSVNKRAPRSPAYKTVLIDGVEQNVVITSTANLYEKKINAMPNEHIYAGSIVEWNGRHFIINYTDCEDEIYQRGLMQQCNIYLKWQNEQGEIIGRYGFSEDISQYAAGVVNNKIFDSLELNFKINLPMDEETVLLRRGRRFLLDVVTDEPNAYILTNRNVNSMNFLPSTHEDGEVFDGRDKILQITLSQTQLSKADNLELMVADYYKLDDYKEPILSDCKISYKGKPEIKLGGNYKTFTAEFFDSDGNALSIIPIWKVTTTQEAEGKILAEYVDNCVKLKAPDYSELLNTQIKLEATDGTGLYNAELYVKVVSLYG